MMEAFHPWEEGAGCHSTTVQEANDRGEAHTPLLTRYTIRSMIATVQEGLSESSPDNSARIVLASMRLGCAGGGLPSRRGATHSGCSKIQGAQDAGALPLRTSPEGDAPGVCIGKDQPVA
jgi:hypothetical protein